MVCWWGAISLKSLKFPPPLSMFKTISLKDHVGHIIYQSTLHLLAVAFLWEYILRILSFLEYPNLIRPFKNMIWYDTGHLTVSQFTSQNILKSLIPPPPSAMICDFRCAQVWFLTRRISRLSWMRWTWHYQGWHTHCNSLSMLGLGTPPPAPELVGGAAGTGSR